MDATSLYPLRFEPIFKKALWGGRRLAELTGKPLPGDDPFGEAWILSDQGNNLSRVINGPLRGQSLRDLVEGDGTRLLGPGAERYRKRFPLLLKFIDAQQALSVQVHPHDRHTDLVPPGDQGKTEAWVVLHADPDSRIYAGLRPGTTEQTMRQAIDRGTLQECLHWFTPKPGDCIFIPAGTVHALGAGVVIFEVQQSSDITFRLFDWNRVDAQTRQPRQLHIEQSLAVTDYARGPREPVVPVAEPTAPAQRERLVDCEYFKLWRLRSEQPFSVGAANACRILICIDGQADIRHRDESYPLRGGEVLLLPAEVGACACRPSGRVTLLECGLPV